MSPSGTRITASSSRIPLAGMLPRTRLVESLLASRAARVALLEAPAGYAKTTTLRLWDEADPRPFIWVSCEPRYNDPSLLIEVIVEALGEAGEVPPEVLMALSSPVPDLTLVLSRLARAIEKFGPFVLVVDDAHLLSAEGAWQVLYAVIVALPAKSQVAVATRSRPGLPVGRLRARGELHEVGMADLALTRRESRELLSGLDIDPGALADQIHEQAEGWPAALYLSGLAIRQGGHAPTEDWTFSGGDRVMVEYFRDEFFSGMAPEKARFLYMTSILEELNGPLCDAIVGRSDSAIMLEELSRENALVVALDRNGASFRYHHLFADMLVSELRLREPQTEAELHHRAATWLAGNGEIPRATDHAIKSGDLELAGALIWLDIPDITGRGRLASLDRWCEQIGYDQVERLPPLIMAKAHCSLVAGESDEVYYWLSVADREIDEGSPMFADLLMLRATVGPEGPKQMIEDASRAAEMFTPTNPWKVPVNLYRGIGMFLEEDEQAEEFFRTAAREAVNVSPIIQALALAQLALSKLERDLVDEAYVHVIRARDQVERCGLGSLPVMSLVYAVLAQVLVRRGKAADSTDTLSKAMEMSKGMEDFPGWYEAELLLTCCRTLVRAGQFESAESLYQRTEEVVRRQTDSPRLVDWLGQVRQKLDTREGVAHGRVNLTKAELRTLRFLPSHHSFRAIGDQLYLSQNTVKTQANSLYRKLGVNSRAEAVMEGRRLGLLEGEGQ